MPPQPETPTRWLNRQLTAAVRPYARAAALTVASAASYVAFCFYLSRFVGLWLAEDLVQPLPLLLALLFLTGRYVAAHGASAQNYRASNIIVDEMKKQLYPVLLRNSRLDSTSSALYVTKISDDLKPYFAFFIPYAAASALVSLLLLAVCFWVEPWVGVVLLVALLVIPMQMMVIGIGAEALHKRHINLFLRYAAVFYNRLKTVAEIVNLDNLKTQYAFLLDKSTELNRATTRVMRVAILSSAVLELFVTISIAAIAIYLGMSLLGIMPGTSYNAGYDFPKSLFLLTLAPYFFFYLRKFVSGYHDRSRAVAAAEVLMPVLQAPTTEPLACPDEPLRCWHIGALNFAYPDSPVKVLNGITFDFPTKGLVLIKGISGSGKSTLLKICAGSLSVNEGVVSVNGNGNAWSEQWLHANSSYMNQFPFIFDGTLRYNVALGAGDDVVFPSFLHPLVRKKPDGWDTVLSHNGKQLSGGERQLVTLARLMLRPRPIAILDEPTANLDPQTIAVILPQIVKMAEERLVIVASHEPAFEQLADRTIHLNWGEQSPSTEGISPKANEADD